MTNWSVDLNFSLLCRNTTVSPFPCVLVLFAGMAFPPKNNWGEGAFPLDYTLITTIHIIHHYLYRVAQNKRPEVCVTIMAHILNGAKLPLAHL